MKILHHYLAPALSTLMLMAGITTAGAASVVQNQNVTDLGEGFVRYSWNAFDTNLGTLTSAVIVVSGTYSGSFSVQASTSLPTTVSNSSVYTVSDAPGMFSFVETNWTTSPASGSTVAPFTTQTFTIQGTPEVTINSGNLIPGVGSAYFTTASFVTELYRSLSLSTTGGASSTDPTNVRLNGTVSLTYTYTPSAVEPVPEISTVTMGGAGGLLLLGIAARSRRRQQPSDNVPA
jgi:hypothetical protein